MENSTIIHEQQSGTEEPGKHKHRSPAYPAISLRKALERVKQFHTAQKHHAAPVSGALNLWEFKAKSSGGLQAVSALKQYGLMTEIGEGDARQVQLTDLALRIVRDERQPSPERDEAIRKAALTPKIYAELWSKWDADLPAEPTIRFFLEHDKKYNGAYIGDLIADYKDTIAFAKLAETDKVPPEDERRETIAPTNEDGNQPSLPKPLSLLSPGVKLMEGERVVFAHEIEPTHGVRIIASGEVDDSVLDALELYIQLQKRRLDRQRQQVKPSNEESGQ